MPKVTQTSAAARTGRKTSATRAAAAKTTTAKAKAAAKVATRKAPGSVPGTITPGPVQSLTEKVTGKILMVSPRGDGTLFLINGARHDFLIRTDHENYAAMVSTMLAAQGQGADLAVKYAKLVRDTGPRTVSSIAKGVHAVISGGSF